MRNRVIAPQSHRPPARPGPTTPERILDSAERLFAERGIEGVSVRAILSAAGVNVALAHRHFGSRDGLIDALLERGVAQLNRERLARLDEVEGRGDGATLEDVLRAFYGPAVRWIFERPRSARVLGHVQASPNPKIRAMHRKRFRELLPRFGEALRRRMPDLPADAILCRFWFVLGAGMITATSWADIAASGRARFGARGVPDRHTLLEELVAFCAAGIRATAGEAPKQARARGLGRSTPK